MKEITIKTEFIKLQQFLKLAGIIFQGSDAKIFIADELIKVNGEICTQRGKKIKQNDIIEIKDFGKYKIVGE